jgi:hypothetical protein
MKTRSQPMLTPESNSSRGECSKAFRDIEARKKDRRVIVASSSDRYGAAIHGKERKGMRSNILEIARIGDLNGWVRSWMFRYASCCMGKTILRIGCLLVRQVRNTVTISITI